MNNIWEFLLQSMTVTLVAYFILFLKKVFEDKLPPSWQYHIWSLFFLRLLLPVLSTKQILITLPLLLETWKTKIEYALDSNFTQIFEPLKIDIGIPYLLKLPCSVTDWIFVFYLLGVIFFMMYSIISYLQLRKVLNQAKHSHPNVNEVSGKYHLPTCLCVESDEIDSAFIFGILHPILILPHGQIDEKIILHELLHLKYKDHLQNTMWCFFQWIHWCNPLLHPIFRQIQNDLESLCDQRVLENVIGEERRDYGMLLLKMANQKYSRMPFTTSISNGGKFIKQRIGAIARFKKYPQGMALVSGCMLVMLSSPIFIGNPLRVSDSLIHPVYAKDLDKALAFTRLVRCESVYGAIDTYAKGIIKNQGIYLALSSSLDLQENYYQVLSKNTKKEACYYESPSQLARVQHYGIINLEAINKDTYQAYIIFLSEGINEGTGTNDYTTYLVPIQIIYDNGWIVEEMGTWEKTNYLGKDLMFIDHYILLDDYRTLDHFKFRCIDFHLVNQENNLQLDAEVQEIRTFLNVIYQPTMEKSEIKSAAIRIIDLKNKEDLYEWKSVVNATGGGVNEDGIHYSEQQFNIDENWNGLLESTEITIFNEDYGYIPEAYIIQVYINDQIVEEIHVERSFLR